MKRLWRKWIAFTEQLYYTMYPIAFAIEILGKEIDQLAEEQRQREALDPVAILVSGYDL